MRRVLPTVAWTLLPCFALRSRKSWTFQVLYTNGFDGLRQVEAEDARVEEELAVQGALDVLRAAEAVLLALEGDVGDGETFSLQGLEHRLGLVRGNYLVLEALKEHDRARESLRVVEGERSR